MNANYLKILIGIFAFLVVFEWGHGIQKIVTVDKIVPTAIPMTIPERPVSPREKKTVAISVPLFGEYMPDDVGAAGVKRSALNVTVVGILFDANEKNSQVMLAFPEHQVKVFGVGDSLPGGAVIKRITPEGILVMHQGVLESLTLPKNELHFAPIPEALH